MKTKDLKTNDFMDWYEDTFTASSHLAISIVTNVLEYARKNADKLDVVSFLSDVLPEVTKEEVARFISIKTINLPDGYKWVHNGDGSGHIESPYGKSYFSYERQANTRYVEYQKDAPFGPCGFFEEGFDAFMQFAESEIRKIVRENIKESIADDYYSNSVEFSSGYLDIPCKDFHMSLLDAVELYADLQLQLNGDYVLLVKDPVIEGKRLVSATVCDFTEVFSIDDRIDKKANITLLLIQALIQVNTKKDYQLVRLDKYESLFEGEIKNGELLDFIF